METSELEAKVYAGLIGDEQMTSLLSDGAESVYHMQAPSGDYSRTPLMVYTAISDVPSLHSDDAETLHRVTIRIHIITDDGGYAEIYEHVKRIMSDIGFTRLQTTPIRDRGKKMLAADFRILIGG